MSIESLLPHGFIFSRIDAAENGITGYLHQGSFCELDNGDLLYVVGATKKPGDAPGDLGFKSTYMWRSADKGRSWKPVETPFEGNSIGTESACGLIMNTKEGLILPGSMISKDNGYTWGSFESNGTDWKNSNPISNGFEYLKKIIEKTGEAGFNQWGPCNSCRPEILPDGSIMIMPCASWLEEPPSTTKNTLWFLRSEDLGRTWKVHGFMKRPPTNEVLCEPSIVKLPDGRWLALVRSYNTILEQYDGSLDYKGSRYYYLAISEDECRTWGEPWPCYLGSERWNGAMAEMCLIDEYLYIVGSFSQFQPPDFSGWSKDWEEGTQRTPLLLLRVPLEQATKGKGAFMLEPDAVRPLGISLNLKTRLSGTYASMQMEMLSDRTLGIICDSHTHENEEGNVFFWRVDPAKWFDKISQHALWRGPIPLVTKDDREIRILHTQTTVRPTTFPTGKLPVEISCTIRPHNFERTEKIIQPIFTVWNSADLTVPATPYPHAIFASLDVQTVYPKDGNCYFVVNTGAGREKINVTAFTERDYEVKFIIHSRLEWSLRLNGKEIGRFRPVCPGVPANYTLGHEMYPGRDIDVGFREIRVHAVGKKIFPLEHPFLLERFTHDGQSGNMWHGGLGHFNFMRNETGWAATLAGKHWTKWFRFGGLALSSSRSPDEELLALTLDGKKIVALRDCGECIECLEGANLEEIRRLKFGNSRSVGLAASSLHERTYLCANGMSTEGRKGSLLPYPGGEKLAIEVSASVQKLLIIAWDTAPASMLRLI